ncbi:hypothetical protein [Streptomyces sp. G7(2002)]|uniref:hypothetical protein n=1 Tax=Streptomyces sp. G7(2002) TaxID=2971798 RepID=UPI00237EC10D|nr:hypothetical protein [Streptomyces sp. G7(2002)]WDT54966.1 hypothetical protein NUT86_13330 [Streptomyces sp. G7(2002)]
MWKVRCLGELSAWSAVSVGRHVLLDVDHAAFSFPLVIDRARRLVPYGCPVYAPWTSVASDVPDAVQAAKSPYLVGGWRVDAGRKGAEVSAVISPEHLPDS